MGCSKFTFLIFSLAVLSLSAMAASVEISPKYARIPVNASQIFEISLVGEGGLYDVKAYGGSNLDWNTKSLWVGSYGKKERVTFTPDGAGTYIITVEMGGERDSAEVEVYEPKASNIQDKIEELRSQLTKPEDIARLNEVERLYNESRMDLAEIRLQELMDQLSREVAESTPSTLPYILLVLLLLLAAVAVAKIVL